MLQFLSNFLQTSRLLVLIACALLVYSFVSLDGKSDGKSDGKIDNHETEKAKSDEKDPRLVFMVIDAFRLSFLTSPDSPMSFTKSSLSSAHAILFDAYARMPTVTLPRITAYITGTLPSFGTILTNLATDEIKIDNWISRLRGVGKRIHFFGDDTWIRLLPGKFEKSEGVTSFFVNDYTEVDQNVTMNLDLELLEDSESPWDVLILHYLGLDHIGHSLGGNSPKIPEKLKEMDEIIRRISAFLSSQNSESYLIVCGDHGMTSAGSHGGASPDETRVPVIIWKIGQKIDNRFSQPPEIEQIDLSATIFDLFNLNFPPESYGISLVHYFRGEAQEGLRKQHGHFKALVKDKQLGTSDICETDCDYSNIFVKNSLKKWFRSVQEELIGTASEIPTTSIWICVFILAVATILSAASQDNYSNLLILLINLINFASSLIEEEHEVWYFLGSTVVAIRLIICIKKREFGKARLAFVLGILHRISFGYTQSTRRRWEMDPNLLPQSLFSDFFDRKVMDLNEFFKDKAAFAIAIPLLLCADNKQKLMIVTPILARSAEYFGFPSFFHNFIRFSVFPIYYLTDSPLHAVAPWILLLVPESQLPLCLLVFLIGLCTRILKLGDVDSFIFCMSSFFYFGNSNSLSTLSLTSAYIGLRDYYPILVGIQLILYTFAGPIFFILGRYLSTAKPPPTEIRDPPPFLSPSTYWLRLFFSYRIFSLTISLICLYHFQNHLFVWSVYSPKVVYDMAHVIFSGCVSFYCLN
ncbi:hypothetical protein B9Z55_004848 [Caenorhabditis nigoni]|uniref:GPI ethanolamine phosphate transferase 2 C-terminal domain-containing protein n=1 Tax=Caenorhabditis nigoni TaxID=1611254 RepID=A0A2G5UYA7_9PELO|nr:hypothetical protein B9Z55_004848 [Caenorhabditis nigoni]